MISFPKAKINIGLKVVAKRTDGYHDIETVFYPIPLSDALEFIEIKGKQGKDELVVTGINIRTPNDKNLIIKALTKLREGYSVPRLRIHLHKAIPAGAGLGGGSSDAACMLLSLIRLFKINAGEDELKVIALETGSDCPFFLDPKPSFATGRGEILKPVNTLPEGYRLLILNPGISISTKEAYFNSKPSKSEISLEELYKQDISDWKKLIVNDFEDYVFKVYPEIQDLKKALYHMGALYCSMTGSGSTVYGIFNDKPKIPVKLREYVIYSGVL